MREADKELRDTIFGGMVLAAGMLVYAVPRSEAEDLAAKLKAI